MIQVTFLRDSNDAIQEVELSGHAGFAEHGEDIVCAAVSSQAISVENSLQKLLGIPVQTTVDNEDGGYLRLQLPVIDEESLAQQAQLLLSHLEFALEVLAENYPEYITIN